MLSNLASRRDIGMEELTLPAKLSSLVAAGSHLDQCRSQRAGLDIEGFRSLGKVVDAVDGSATGELWIVVVLYGDFAQNIVAVVASIAMLALRVDHGLGLLLHNSICRSDA